MTQLYDASSCSNYTHWQTVHTALDVDIRFDRHALEGKATLTLEARAPCDEIILDTSYLTIKAVTVDGETVKYELQPRKEPLGQPLKIHLARQAAANLTRTVVIEYSTTEKCTALQFLDPAQTAGSAPYMFSQCQAIHARSMYPCQDTPLVKSKFNFKLRSPYPVVATGVPKGASHFKDGTLLYEFDQHVPIPTYLAAFVTLLTTPFRTSSLPDRIASGDLATAQIGPRSTLYTEPKFLYETQREMAPVIDKFIQIAESFLPKYAWSIYNVLVLPQSFPYGPTVLAGDGSNLDVVAHELSHSWSGNLVTCAGWSHFWLNEGWTVFLERKIIEKLHGKKYAEFSAIIGWKALEESVKNYGDKHEFTKLIQNLDGIDPDDSFSSVPYEKGFNFLYHLESLLGAESFVTFAHFYFTKFAGLSITSHQFKASLYEFYTSAKDKDILDSVDWDDKFYSPGLPPRPNFDTTVAIPCYDLAKRWIDANDKGSTGFSETDVKGWEAGQFQVFLETLSSSRFNSASNVIAIGHLYHLTQSKNAEVLFRYYVLALGVGAKEVYPEVAQFLGTVGRMKFVRPLFRGLYKVDQGLARKTFESVGKGLHPICRDMVKKDLHMT